MDAGRFVVEAHLKERRPIAELAAYYGVSRSWAYKRLARYLAEGEAGLEPRSKRPHRVPGRIADLFEDEIVSLRKELSDYGTDDGADSIHTHLARRHKKAKIPSVSTIQRVLKARGFVTPEPKKRPNSSYRRFVAELPNERWQADVTHLRLSDGSTVEILNVIDDHSRLCVASHVFRSTRAVDVVRTLHVAGRTWGYPASFLSDNGAVFTSLPRGGTGALEAELLSLGIETKHSRPYHPQTCGKVERFHQTLKKHLAKQDPAETKKQLQGQINRFVRYYNEVRPHRGIDRATPLEVFQNKGKAHPKGPRIDTTGYRLRRDRVDKSGRITIRYAGKLHHIGLGNRFQGTRVFVLIKGRDIKVIQENKRPLRHLILDPRVDYQRIP
jgi:transposase InsO family protein